MKVGELLETRRDNWRELEDLCLRLEGPARRLAPSVVVRFASLYRAACADLALADAYQLPPGTVTYLHQLVGRAHNQLYRSRTFQLRRWANELFVQVPRRLFNDNCLRLAFCIFWGLFVLTAVLAYRSREFAETVIRKEMMLKLEDDFSKPIGDRRGALMDPGDRTGMVGFYIYNNAGIGLRCFAYGLLLGVGGLYMTAYNAALLGEVFGHMATVPQGDNFFHFVTAHGPFELTAVVLSAAAGMRLGFSIVDPRGMSRMAALHKAGQEATPVMIAAMIMFGLAALIEGFLSPSPAPYWCKAAVAVFSSGLLLVYFVGLGYVQED